MPGSKFFPKAAIISPSARALGRKRLALLTEPVKRMKRRSLLILSTAWAITSLFLACGGDDASQGTGADASTNDVTSDVANGGDSGGDSGGPGKDAGGGDSSSAD